MELEFMEKMERIIAAIKAAGYAPYPQLYGYLKNDDPAYITRSGGARELIGQLEKEDIRQYVEKMPESRYKAEPTD